MSSDSRWGSASATGTGGGSSSSTTSASSSTSKGLSQQGAALKMKAMSQLRQVLRTSPNARGAFAFTLGKDFLIVLRCLPAGIMNKVNQMTGIAEMSSNAKDSIDSTDQTKDNKSIEEKSLLKATALPTTVPSPGKQYPIHPPPQKVMSPAKSSVLRNILEINTQNNRVIDTSLKMVLNSNVKSNGTKNNSTGSTAKSTTVQKETKQDLPIEKEKEKKEVITEENASLSSGSPPPPTPVPPPEKKPTATTVKKDESMDNEHTRFLERNLMWQNIEARTEYLVAALQKSVENSSNSNHNLVSHLDDLFSHIYQHHETRVIAIKSGVIKVLTKLTKTQPIDSYVVLKSRETLALLGINPPTKGKGIKILSIDGGGVRGLVAIEVLRAVERITGKKTCDLFDYICGVSTGSILAFLLGAHKKSLDEAELLYKDLSKEIFSQNSFFGNAALLWSHSYYHTPTFERILKKHCGEVPLISLARDPQLPRVSAISTVVNQERVSPYVFRTYTLPPTTRAKYIGGCRYHMWEAVRASAAAPTYFEEFKLGNYLHQDGGVLVNNPTSVAISEAKMIWNNVPIQCVVSLGTGLTLSSNTDKNLNDLIEHGKEGMSYLSWKGKFLKVLDSATDTESVHNTLNELLPHDIYFRFNPYLTDVVRLDEALPEKLASVQQETRDYLERNVEKVNFACQTLTREKSLSKKLSDWWYYN